MTNPFSVEVFTNPKPNYDSFFGQGTPYFFPGEQITGVVKYDFKENMKPLKYKGISVKLCCCIYKHKQIEEIINLATLKLQDSGIISESFSYEFKFDTLESFPQSYLGAMYSFTYTIIATIHKVFSQIETSAFALIISPLRSIPDQHPINFALSNDYITGKISFNNEVFENTATVEGSLIVNELKIEDIASISLQLLVIEKYRDATTKEVVYDYQIADGSPRIDTEIPFYLDIKRAKLWGITKQNYFKFSVNYAFRLNIKVSSGHEIHSKQIPVEIYHVKYTI